MLEIRHGVSFEDLTGSATKLNKVLASAQTGNTASAEAFKKLGVAIKDTSGNARSSNDVYNDTLTKLAEMGDTAEANALGNQIFGKSFANLKPLLAEGAGGIDDLKNKASELGIVMSDEAIASGDNFSDTLGAIKTSMGGLLNQLLGSVMPVIQPILDKIIQSMPRIQEGIQQFAPIIAKMFEQLLPPIIQLAEQLFPIIVQLIQQLLPPIMQIIQQLLPIFLQIINIIMPPLMQIIQLVLPVIVQLINSLLPLLQPIIALLQPIIELLMTILEPLIQLLNFILPPLIVFVNEFIKIYIPILTTYINFLKDVIVDVISTVVEHFKAMFTNIKNIFTNIIDFVKNVFTGNWAGAWENVKTIFANIVGGFANVIKLPLNFMIDGINAFIKGVNKIKLPDWEVLGEYRNKGFSFPLMQKLRVGIDYVPYDEMPALLHKGERVLTADENKAMLNSKKIEAKTNNIVVNFYPQQMTETELEKAFNYVNKKYSEAF